MEYNLSNYGFQIERKEYIEEANGTAYTLKHQKSGAKLLYLDNDDENKAFSIGFKTLPEDSTGVFHILEHSVLSGSEKYPLKSPFVELMKGSMKNFLNAMTFSDKTLFLFSTVNEKDYINLMDVYLDAVFHPLIYTKKEIFQQEGWHYELSADGKPDINGVVYNEMKGAFSSVDTCLSAHLQNALFPQSIYRHVSGGYPDAIPQLTYEKFLETHRKYYRADNCFIFLYGKMDIAEKLKFLNEAYLSGQAAGAGEYPISLQRPVTDMDYTCTYHAENKTGRECQAALCCNIGTFSQREEVLAAHILFEALAGSNEAPLKRAVLEKGLSEDFFAYVNDSIMQPYAIFYLRNTDISGEKAFPMLLERVAADLCSQGIPRELLVAAVNKMDFMLRDKSVGMPEGIVNAIETTTGWVYGSDPTVSLRYHEYIQNIRSGLEHGYFENLLKKIVLDNAHKAYVRMQPEDGIQSKSSCVPTSFTPEQSEKIRVETQALREMHAQKDTREIINKLPTLRIDDLKSAVKRPETIVSHEGSIPVLHHLAQSTGICLIRYYFDLGGLSAARLPYAALLAELLGSLDTQSNTAEVLKLRSDTQLGRMNAYVDCCARTEAADRVLVKFVLDVSVLDEQMPYALTIPEELLYETLFNQKEKIHLLLQQKKLFMEQHFISDGNLYASRRAASYYSLEGLCRERISGISYYQFICGLLTAYDAHFDALAEELIKMQKWIVENGSLTVSFTGGPFDAFIKLLHGSCMMRHGGCGDPQYYRDSLPQLRQEAFKVPSNVSYVIQGYSLCKAGIPLSGKLQVLAKILTYDYLWENIRASGGAYGTGMQVGDNGNVIFFSYRDPNVAKTYQTYAKMPDYLAAFSASERDMAKYIIGAIAQFDAPRKVGAFTRERDWQFFTGWPEEMHDRLREEILSTTPDDIRGLASDMTALLRPCCRCTVGSSKEIAAAREFFESISDLTK